MSTVEIETGRYVKRFEFWNPSTWAVPALYWDTFSQEQRIHAICKQLGKVIAYADYLGVNVDDIAARLKAIEDGELDDFIVAAIEEWFEENQPAIIAAIAELQEICDTKATVFNTAIEMQASDSLKDGQICQTLGFRTKGDNGAGIYIITDTATANGYDVLQCGDLFAEFVYLDESYYPEQFGAYGDGTNDDATPIVYAFSNGKCKLSAKTYLVGDAFTETSEIIVIEGVADSKILCDGAFYLFENEHAIVDIENATFDGNGKCYGVFTRIETQHYLNMRNCIVTGFIRNPDVSYLPGCHALTIAADIATIENCKVIDNATHGLIVFANSSYNDATAASIKIDNCTAYNNYVEVSGNKSGIGIGAYSDAANGNLAISNCLAYENGDSGIGAHGVGNTTIMGCTSYGNYEHGLVLQQVKQGNVNGCITNGNTGYGIRIQGDYSLNVSDRFVENCIVSGCVFTEQRGAYVGVAAKNIDISNNNFIGIVTPFYFDDVDSRNVGSDSVLIHDNVINYADTITAGHNFIDLFNNIACFDNKDKSGKLLPDGFIRYNESTFGMVCGNTSDLSLPISPANTETTTFVGSSGATYTSNTLAGTSTNSIGRWRLSNTDNLPVTVAVRIPKGHTLRPEICLRNSDNSLLTLPGGGNADFTFANNHDETYENYTFTVVPITTVPVVELALKFTDSENLSYSNVFIGMAFGYKVFMP